MEGQEINLKWKSFHSNIVTGFESLWEEEGLVDVTLASDGRCLKAHKVILSASSPFFKEIFMMNPCKHPVIVLQDVHYTELLSILTFVYKGEVNILQENLPCLLRAAETLQIRGLCRQVDPITVAEEDDVNAEDERSPSPPPVEAVLNPPRSPPVKRRKPSPPDDRNWKTSAPISSPPVALDSSHIKEEPVAEAPMRITETRRSPTPIPPATAAVFPIPHELVRANIRPESPAISEASGDDPIGGAEPPSSEVEHTQDSPKNFPYPPFPCPFCDRAYTRWGFRRRHIKSCHTKTQRLPCKWCTMVLPSHPEWENHVCLKHSLSRVDARNGLLILEEAEVVLQIPQPTRLDALVTMIKDSVDEPQEDKNDELQNESVQW